MSFKVILQFILALSLILFAAVVTRYEGSELLDNPWEWKYSAPFSNMLNGEINGKQDISQLDFFIYAVKFKPVYPTVLLLSNLYFIILSGYIFLSMTKLCYFLRIIGALFIFLSTFFSNSPTMGAEVIRNTLLLCSVSLIGISFIISFFAVRKTTI